jgi:predicted small secreted protein
MFRRLIMKTLKDVIVIVVLFAAALCVMLSINGCGTVRGIGEDLQNFGAYETRN